MALDLGTLAAKLTIDTSEFEKTLRGAPAEAADAGAKSGKQFGDRFDAEASKKTRLPVTRGASAAETTRAGVSAGRRFGEGFANAAQRVVNALAIGSSIGTQVQATVDKQEGSLATMSAAAGLGANNLGALNAEFSKVQSKLFIWQTGTSAATGFGDALRQVVNNSKGFDAVATQTQSFIAGLVGTKTAAGELSGQVDKLDQSLAGMDLDKAQAAFTQVTKAVQAQGVGVDDLVNQFPEYKASLLNIVAALGVAEPSVQEYADWMGGKLPAAVIAAANAQPELAAKLGITTTSMQDAAASANSATKAVVSYMDKIAAASSKQLGLSDAQIEYQRAVDDAEAALKKNGRTLDIHTKKGQDNHEALNRLAGDAIAVAQRMKEAGKSDKAVSDQLGPMRAEYIKMATSMGMAKDEAAKLADKLGLIKDKTVTVTTVFRNATVAAGARGAAQVARAVGGRVPGVASSDRDDKVPLLATPEEWVIQRRAARYYGDAVMSALNAGSIPRELFTMRADGGKVGGSTLAPVPAPVASSLGGRGVTINMTSYYPRAEPRAVETVRALAIAAIAGR